MTCKNIYRTLCHFVATKCNLLGFYVINQHKEVYYMEFDGKLKL